MNDVCLGLACSGCVFIARFFAQLKKLESWDCDEEQPPAAARVVGGVPVLLGAMLAPNEGEHKFCLYLLFVIGDP